MREFVDCLFASCLLVRRLETPCGTPRSISAISTVYIAAHQTKQPTTSANEVVTKAYMTHISTVNKEIDKVNKPQHAPPRWSIYGNYCSGTNFNLLWLTATIWQGFFTRLRSRRKERKKPTEQEYRLVANPSRIGNARSTDSITLNNAFVIKF